VASDTVELRPSADQEVTRPMCRPTLRYGCEGWASFCLILDARESAMFEDTAEHHLKDLLARWHLYQVVG
jgi:hypothetical protein